MLDGWSLLWLDGHVKSLMDICGACERIRYTPLSSSYRALLRHGIALYVLISPFYLIEDIGPSSFPLFVLAAYFLLGIEMVAEEIEEPFQLERRQPSAGTLLRHDRGVGTGDSGGARSTCATAGCVIKISVIPARIGLPFSRSRSSFSPARGFPADFAENGPFSADVVAYRGRGRRSIRSRLVLIGYVCPRVPMSARERVFGS